MSSTERLPRDQMVDASTFAAHVAPSDPEQALLPTEEFARLVYLLALLNDVSVTQLDTDECRDLSRLLYKISNDGDESGRER